MAARDKTTRQIRLRLIHDGTEPGTPLGERLRFGVQDTKGEVEPGSSEPGAIAHLDLTLSVDGSEESGPPVFRGACAHGPPAKRFVYLSWKRAGTHAAPWGWRIKIPLSGIGWDDIHAAQAPGARLVADVMGRKPHSSETVAWVIESGADG